MYKGKLVAEVPGGPPTINQASRTFRLKKMTFIDIFQNPVNSGTD